MGPLLRLQVARPLRGTRWLVTGGAGFLGRSLVGRLLQDGARVRAFDTADPAGFPFARQVDYVRADVRDAAAVEAATSGVDYVVHTAAALPIHRSKAFIRSVNVEGMRNVLAAAQRHSVKGVVFTSSTAVYGLPKHHPILESSPMVPVGPYGESKVAAEALCQEARANGLHVCVLRAKTFLGPGRLGVFEILFDWIRDGKRIYLLGAGHNKYQLLDVDDLVDAIVLGATTPQGNDDYNLGATEFGTLRQDLGALFKEAGTKARFRPLPAAPAIAALWTLDKLRLSPLTKWHYGTMAKDSYVDTQKAQTKLGWRPKRSNQEAMIAAYHWYHAHRSEFEGKTGTGHTLPWKQGALKWLRGVS
jgi:nucleoside-diphosphate-sugar epimerase